MSDAVHREWVHALRNAVNANVASLAVVRRALENGDLNIAKTFIAHAETAGERCRELLLGDIAAGKYPGNRDKPE